MAARVRAVAFCLTGGGVTKPVPRTVAVDGASMRRSAPVPTTRDARIAELEAKIAELEALLRGARATH